jgi:hypothetical protein
VPAWDWEQLEEKKEKRSAENGCRWEIEHRKTPRFDEIQCMALISRAEAIVVLSENRGKQKGRRKIRHESGAGGRVKNFKR